MNNDEVKKKWKEGFWEERGCGDGGGGGSGGGGGEDLQDETLEYVPDKMYTEYGV